MPPRVDRLGKHGRHWREVHQRHALAGRGCTRLIFGDGAAAEAHVGGDRHAQLDGARPEPVVLLGLRDQVTIRPLVQHDATHARHGGDALEFGDRVLDRRAREYCEAEQPIGILRGVLLRTASRCSPARPRCTPRVVWQRCRACADPRRRGTAPPRRRRPGPSPSGAASRHPRRRGRRRTRCPRSSGSPIPGRRRS